MVKAKAKSGSHIYVTGEFSTSDFRRINGELGYDLLISVHDWCYVSGPSNKESGVSSGNAVAGVGVSGDGSADNHCNEPNDYELHNNVHHPPNQEEIAPGFIPEIMNLDDDGLPFPVHYPD